jgi:hypothetical protein
VNLTKTIQLACALALLAAGKLPRAEEQHSVLTALNSTTLNGYVDTSASWWGGGVHVIIDSYQIPIPPGPPPPFMSGPANDPIWNPDDVPGTQISIPPDLTSAKLDPGEITQPQQTGSVWYKWSATQTGVARIATSAIPAMPPPAATSTLPALSQESIFYPDGGISHDGGGGGSVGGVITISPPPIDPVLIGYYRWWTDLVVYRAIRLPDTEYRFEFVQRGASLEFEAQQGETFWVGVEVFERQPAFEGQIELPSLLPGTLFFDLTPPAANDSFASNLSVADSYGGTMTGYVLAATREEGEPDLGGEFSGGSAWFHFTVATYGTVAISDISQNLPLAIFTGNTVSNLSLVAKSLAGGIAFFAEPGKQYHLAVYRGTSTAGFNLSFLGPSYRLYETTLDALMPNGAPPHFYGVRGRTMLLYSKVATGWDLVEVEPIVNESTDLLIRPGSAVDGQLRVITVDESLPSPRLLLATSGGVLNVGVVGIPGQTCGVSYSTDLFMWSPARVITLKSAETFVQSFDGAGSNYFFRVFHAWPRTPGPPPPIPTP